MKLPIWLIALLPKRQQKTQIQKMWDNKSDESIRAAYKDAMGWVDLSNTLYSPSGTIRTIADDCLRKLDKYIKPQMRKRGLDYER